MMIKVLFNVLSKIIRLNLVKTLYFNFKFLPFKKSIKLPFHFHGKVDFNYLGGKVILNSNNVKFGMISFGGDHEVVVSSKEPTRIVLNGILEFTGKCTFGKGVNLVVWKNGHIQFNDNFSIGSNSKVISFKKIVFGNNNLISWNCNFYDTDFHFIKNLETNKIIDNCLPISIGNNVWIGSNVTALKGTLLPNSCIVGASSLCTGNYKKLGENIIIGGFPASLLKHNFSYIFDKQEEKKLFNKYINY